ncbi:hypothetical protein MASR2M78_09090 [Treponema sp.]
MRQVNVFQAKTDFSKLIAMLENGEEDEIVIACNGNPTVRLTLSQKARVENRIGVAKGIFTMPERRVHV